MATLSIFSQINSFIMIFFCGFCFQFSNMVSSIFLFAYWPAVYLLWWQAYSSTLDEVSSQNFDPFLLDCFSIINWIFRVLRLYILVIGKRGTWWGENSKLRDIRVNSFERLIFLLTVSKFPDVFMTCYFFGLVQSL